MTSAPRRRDTDEEPRRSRSGERKDVALETFEQDVRQERDISRVVQDNPDGPPRALDPAEGHEAAAADEA